MSFNDFMNDPFKDFILRERMAFTITNPNAFAKIVVVDDGPIVTPKKLRTIEMADYEFRYVLARALTFEDNETALAIYDVVVPGAEFCLGACWYDEDADEILYSRKSATLSCPAAQAEIEFFGPLGARFDTEFWHYVGASPGTNYKVVIT